MSEQVFTSVPLVSVIIPMFNAGKYINAAIDSVLAQTFSNIEIIAINDGSTDDTSSKISHYLTLPKFKYIEQVNSGVSAARNAGLRAATGDMIAFLDHDDLWLPDKLEKQIRFLGDHPNIGLVHGNISFIDADGMPIPRERSNFQTDASGWCFAYLFNDNRIATLTVCMRRECFSNAGFFREDIHGAEDYEYWLRVAQKYPIGHIDEDLALYRLHGANATSNWLPQLVDLTKALEGILAHCRRLNISLPKDAVVRRLFPLHERVARELYRRNEHTLARPHLLRALALKPATWEMVLMLMVGLLPSDFRKALRWYWKKLG